MILDGVDIGLGEVVITDSSSIFNNVEIKTNRIQIYSKDHESILTFWTIQEYEKFNELELNKKTDVLKYIDDYDVDFNTMDYFAIYCRGNVTIDFTRIDINKYIVNAEIIDLSSYIIGNFKNHKNIKVEAIIDFNNKTR